MEEGNQTTGEHTDSMNNRGREDEGMEQEECMEEGAYIIR